MRVTNKDTLKAYDSGVKAYYDLSPQKVSDHVKEWIDQALAGLDKKAKIFEIGSGTGKDADYIESLGYDIQVSDASSGFVEFLQKNNKNPVTFNILTDDFSTKHDLILADAVFLHFNTGEVQTILQKIHTALKNSGRLAFTVKRGDGDFIEDKKLGSVRYFKLWQQDELVNLLNACGFSVSYNELAEDNRGNKPAWILIIAKKEASA